MQKTSGPGTLQTMKNALTGMTLQVVALLGRATHQAVSQAESPRRWLDYRMRLALLPASVPSRTAVPASYEQRAAKREVKDRALALFAALRPALEGLQEARPRGAGRRGRPGKLTLEGFQAFLGVRGEESFLVAFARYCKVIVDRVCALLQGAGVLSMSELRTLLDPTPEGGGWLPTHPKNVCEVITS